MGAPAINTRDRVRCIGSVRLNTAQGSLRVEKGARGVTTSQLPRCSIASRAPRTRGAL